MEMEVLQEVLQDVLQEELWKVVCGGTFLLVRQTPLLLLPVVNSGNISGSYIHLVSAGEVHQLLY